MTLSLGTLLPSKSLKRKCPNISSFFLSYISISKQREQIDTFFGNISTMITITIKILHTEWACFLHICLFFVLMFPIFSLFYISIFSTQSEPASPEQSSFHLSSGRQIFHRNRCKFVKTTTDCISQKLRRRLPSCWQLQ